MLRLIKKSALLLCTLFIISSCGTTDMDFYTSDSRVRKIKANMTKNEVISIMGKSYKVIHGTTDTMTIGYSAYSGGTYVFYFVNDVLKEWEKEYPLPPPPVITTVVH